eukprot:gene3140-biopygen3650
MASTAAAGHPPPPPGAAAAARRVRCECGAVRCCFCSDARGRRCRVRDAPSRRRPLLAGLRWGSRRRHVSTRVVYWKKSAGALTSGQVHPRAGGWQQPPLMQRGVCGGWNGRGERTRTPPSGPAGRGQVPKSTMRKTAPGGSMLRNGGAGRSASPAPGCGAPGPGGWGCTAGLQVWQKVGGKKSGAAQGQKEKLRRSRTLDAHRTQAARNSGKKTYTRAARARRCCSSFRGRARTVLMRLIYSGEATQPAPPPRRQAHGGGGQVTCRTYAKIQPAARWGSGLRHRPLRGRVPLPLQARALPRTVGDVGLRAVGAGEPPARLHIVDVCPPLF